MQTVRNRAGNTCGSKINLQQKSRVRNPTYAALHYIYGIQTWVDSVKQKEPDKRDKLLIQGTSRFGSLYVALADLFLERKWLHISYHGTASLPT